MFVFESSIIPDLALSILECAMFGGYADLRCCAYPSGLAHVKIMVIHDIINIHCCNRYKH
uniref:Uncharacterized protein n=1 Tax=Arundo donax TaxID=35708 RepID=A0A0A9D4C0_ARUDO